MASLTHPISKNCAQDELKNAYLGRPNLHEEASHHPRPKDPFSVHAKDYLAMFNDEESDIIHFTKWLLRGALVGAGIGISTAFLKNYTGFALKKITIFAAGETFGHIK